MDRAEKVLDGLRGRRTDVAEELEFLDQAIATYEQHMNALPTRKPRQAKPAPKRRRNSTVRLSKDPAPLINLLRETAQPMTTSEIAEKLGISSTSVARAVRDLEGELLTVAHERGKGPRERKLISLTAAGQAAPAHDHPQQQVSV